MPLELPVSSVQSSWRGGTLYEAIGKDRSGKLGWYSRCDAHCDI